MDTRNAPASIFFSSLVSALGRPVSRGHLTGNSLGSLCLCLFFSEAKEGGEKKKKKNRKSPMRADMELCGELLELELSDCPGVSAISLEQAEIASWDLIR